jgi:predicted glutamine amidotransferase
MGVGQRKKTHDQKGFVIASRKLTDGEDWQDFRRGSLMVFERGDVTYGAHG